LGASRKLRLAEPSGSRLYLDKAWHLARAPGMPAGQRAACKDEGVFGATHL